MAAASACALGPCATRRRDALGVTVCSAVSMRRRRQDRAAGQEIVELAALADGSLSPERRAALEARVAASSELADRLAEQQRAVELARSAVAEVEAPATLRARIEAPRRARRRPMPHRLGLIGAAAAAVLAVAIGLSVFGSGTSGERFACCARADRTGARRQGRGDTHQDDIGLADRTRRHGTSPPRGRGDSTRRGSATPPACSCRSGRSTRVGTSPCGRVCRRRTSGP